MLRYLVHARAARKSPDSDVDIMIGVDPTVRIGVYEYVAIKDYIAGCSILASMWCGATA